MKLKSYIILTVAATLMAGCQQYEDYDTKVAKNSLDVSVTEVKSSNWGTKTRAAMSSDAPADTLWLNDSIYVEAVAEDIVATEQAPTTRATPVTNANQINTLSIVMFNTKTTKWSDTSTQESGKSPIKASIVSGSYFIDPPYMWLEGDMEYRTLIAMSPYHDSDGFALSSNGQTLGVTVQSDVAKQYDLCVSDINVNKDIQYPIGANSNMQSFEMEHMMTAVGFEAAGYDLMLTGVKFTGVNSKSTLTLHNRTWSTPTTPATFEAKVNQNQWLNSDHIKTSNPWRNITPNDGYMMMLPQTHTDDMTLEFTFSGRNNQPGGTYTMQLNKILAAGASNSDWKPGTKITYRLRLKTRPAVQNDRILFNDNIAGRTSQALSIVTSNDDDLTFSWTASWLGIYRGTNTTITNPESNGYFPPFTTGVNNWANIKFFARSEHVSTAADRTATITVTGKKSGVRTFTVTQPKKNYMKIGNLYWARGNLVANGSNDCKIGNPNDAGLYFKNGSLVGWKGGSNGDGTGMGTPGVSIHTKPANMSSSPFYTTWAFSRYHNGGGFTNNTTLGLGDPCKYYLGGSWRTPTVSDFNTLKYTRRTSYQGSAGIYGGQTENTANISQGIFFPASGRRNQDSGVLEVVNSDGIYLSSDSYNEHNNYGLTFTFFSGYIDNWWRKRAYPVRCVADRI